MASLSHGNIHLSRGIFPLCLLAIKSDSEPIVVLALCNSKPVKKRRGSYLCLFFHGSHIAQYLIPDIWLDPATIQISPFKFF